LTDGPEATERAGAELAATLSPGDVVLVSGELGAGKTTFVRGAAHALGVTEPVTSPTFALVHQYAAPQGTVYHVDLYRLESERELTNIGWDDVVGAHSLVLVEWAERAGSRLPRAHVPIDLEHVAGDPSRRLLLAG
jgi:tRNA threonylcarbamoyladenosine biosynthesis protein TsaE